MTSLNLRALLPFCKRTRIHYNTVRGSASFNAVKKALRISKYKYCNFLKGV